MRFSEHLGAHLTPEWRSQYVEYEDIKGILYSVNAKAPLKEDVGEEGLKRHYAKYEDDFFNCCDKELSKVNTFFAEKLAEAVRKYSELQAVISKAGVKRDDVDTVIGNPNSDFTNEPEENANEKDKDLNENEDKAKRALPSLSHYVISKKKLQELRFVVCEFYLSLVLIQNFQKLNFTAFRKILKKHDKMFLTTSGVEYRIARVESAGFYTNGTIDELILNTETIAIEDLEGGDRSKAMKRLRVLPLSEKQTLLSSFFWGLFTGFFTVLIVVVCIAAYFKGKDIDWEPALRMYRGLFIVFLMIGLLGINIHGWARAGVNHVLIFELDPRNHLTFVEMLMLASFFGTLWGISCLGFLFSEDFGLPKYAHPLALGAFCLLYLVNPTRTFHYRSRRWLLRILFRIATAPYYPVKFADFWLADQLNSLVVPLVDFQYIVCFYTYGWYESKDNSDCTDPKFVIRPIIALLPAWWRFLQCLRRYRDTKKAVPHLVNAGKYSTSMLVTILSTIASVLNARNSNHPLFYVWVCSLIIGTCYTLYWDIKMDWGLFAKNAGENKFLREQIVYNYKAYYYLAVVFDLIFRFLWTLTVSIGTAGFLHHEFFTFFIATCECFRRFVWNFFRLENEHLNNVGEFRAVRDISIKPISNNDIADPQAVELRNTSSSKSTMKISSSSESLDNGRTSAATPHRRSRLLTQVTFSSLFKNLPTSPQRHLGES